MVLSEGDGMVSIMTIDEASLWIQAGTVLAATAAVVVAILAALATGVVAIVLGAMDRRNTAMIAARGNQFQQLFREQELLQRLLENYNRGGSSDRAESARMGTEALTLIGAIGPDRLPELWASHVSSDEQLRELLADPEMPDYKKEAIKVQLALNASRRDLLQLTS